MKTSVVSGTLDSIETEVMVFAHFAEEPLPEEILKLDEKLNDAISKKLKMKEFTGEFRQVHVISTLGNFPAKNIALVGLGKKSDSSLDFLRRAAGHAMKDLRDLSGFTKFAIAAHLADVPDSTIEERAQAVAEGSILGAYQFLKYKTVDVEKIKKVKEIKFIGDFENAFKRGRVIAESACLSRDVVNEPPSVFTPVAMAEEAGKLEELGVKVTVLDEKQIEDKGMHALLAVNSGSVVPPRFVVMEYDGGGTKKVAVVGKGITFDSGGLNIKPGESMLTMKSDMAGAATVLGIVRACAELKLPVRVFGVMALTENMPGQNAYKPGDIVRSYSGKTIEVLNTDAEGRIVLADALTYAERDIEADVIVDLATLTGACVVALGNVCGGVLGDDAVVKKLIDSGTCTGDRLWQLPLWKEYQEQVVSDIGDVRNLGKVRRSAGTITAAAFLRAFVARTPWAHVDIAGTGWSDDDVDYIRKGGTGFGVRLMVDFLEKFK